jgi:uncharacterized protein
MLFGASTLIVVTRAGAAGEDPARVHLARMAVLAGFGTLHWLLLWPGDILLHYAIVGVVALPFTTLEPRQQVRIALLLLLGQAAIQGWIVAGDVALRAQALAAHPPADVAARWRELAAAIGIGAPADVARAIALHHAPFATLVAAHARELAVGTPFLLMFDGPETLAYMLIGMAALSSGLLAGAWPRARTRRLAAATLGIGLPLSALLALAAARSGFDTIATFAAATLGGVALRPVIALGYVALAVPWLAGDGAWRRRIGAAGRCAFTNYLGSSLVMAAIVEGWGFGLFGRLTRGETMLLVPPVWLAMLAWSAPWLVRYRHGPLEWAWRSFARLRPQRFRHY